MKKTIFSALIVSFFLLGTSCQNTTNQEQTATDTTKVEETEKEEVVEAYKVGDVATDFSLKNVDGKMISLASYTKAKGFIVIFTCNHCPFSVAYEDRIIALDKKYAAKGFPVIAINPNDSTINEDDSYSKMIVRAKEKGFTFPYLLDAGQLIFPQYGATKTPHVFILSKSEAGLIVEYIGAIDDNHEEPTQVKEKFVEKAVDALLSGNKPEVNFTKAIGCGIKVSEK